METEFKLITADEMSKITRSCVKEKKDQISFVLSSLILKKAKLSAEKGLSSCFYMVDEAYRNLVSEIMDILSDLGYRVVRIRNSELEILIEWN